MYQLKILDITAILFSTSYSLSTGCYVTDQLLLKIVNKTSMLSGTIYLSASNDVNKLTHVHALMFLLYARYIKSSNQRKYMYMTYAYLKKFSKFNIKMYLNYALKKYF